MAGAMLQSSLRAPSIEPRRDDRVDDATETSSLPCVADIYSGV